jgi:auxin-responsive protein IAA
MSPPLDHDYRGLAPPDDLKGTELRLGLPGSEHRPAATATLDLLPAKDAKRVFPHEVPPPAPAAIGRGKVVNEEADGEEKKVAAPPQPAAK